MGIEVTYELCDPDKAWAFIMKGTDEGTQRPLFFLGLRLEPGFDDIRTALVAAGFAFGDIAIRFADPSEIPEHWAQEAEPEFAGNAGPQPQEVVGESRYVHNFETITGPRTADGCRDVEVEAVLEREPTNSHDPNAVVIKVQGLVVGYLPRDVAPEWQRVLKRLEIQQRRLTCPAFINGGWSRFEEDDAEDLGHYGITLMIATPDELLRILG